MKQAAAILLLWIATSFSGAGQSYAFAQEQASSDSNRPAITLALELAKSLDSKKLKQGDPVEAKITDQWRAPDGTLVPPGSKVMGHVTESSARAKGDQQSQLGIAFDEIDMKDGHKLPLKASIQAIGAPLNYGISQVPMGGPGGTAGAGAPTGPMGGNIGVGPGGGGGTNPVSNFPNPAGSSGNSTNSPQGEPPSTPQLAPQSTGVIGLHDLQLEQGSILASSGKQVKLSSGSQILLRVQDQ